MGEDTIKIISHLRSNVYPTEEFKNTFSKQLKRKIYAENVVYTPDQFGGWNVNVSINKDKQLKSKKESNSACYYQDIMNCLLNSIKSCENYIYYGNTDLMNIVFSGTDSLIIKI